MMPAAVTKKKTLEKAILAAILRLKTCLSVNYNACY